MTPLNGPLTAETIEQHAAEKLTRRQTEHWTSADEAELQAWLQESTAHRIAFIRLDTAWTQTARLKALGAGVPRGTVPKRGFWAQSPPYTTNLTDESLTHPQSTPQSTQQPSPHLRSHPRSHPQEPVPKPAVSTPTRIALRFAAAACVAACAGAILWASTAGHFGGGARYTTPIGGLNHVPLADGSKITLNTDSRIRVALQTKERRIVLDQGEAFFEVAKDPQRPFIVDVGRKHIIAVGTSFLVRRDGDDFRVAVTEGAVRIENSTQRVLAAVDAGGVAQTNKSEVLIHAAATPEVERLLSWRKGYIEFHDTTLADAATEFNRYNKEKIRIADAGIAGIRIGGNFRATNTEAFIWLVKSGFPVDATVDGDTIVLKHR